MTGRRNLPGVAVALSCACLLVYSVAFSEASEGAPEVQTTKAEVGASTSDTQTLAAVEIGRNLIAFQPLISHSQVRVTVTGPEGFQAIQTFKADENPRIELPGLDGFYKYELRFAPVVDDRARATLAAARLDGTEPIETEATSPAATVQSGAFTIANGSVVRSMEESSLKNVLTNADGVVRNSLCVGFDCPDAPTFGDSTILMMENNTRIKFGDTSNSPFPNNDWEIAANSSLSGGANYLGFNDCGSADNDGDCAADLVFAVEAGARESALYVESDGDIGIGTSNPVVDIHVVTGNTPTLRLDQDGSSGFTPQVWDLAGNETNFFIRDVTSGSRLPFRIRPGAPTSSIDIAGTGRVGIGTASPAAPVDVQATASSIGAGNAAVKMANAAGGVAFQLNADNDDATFWNISSISGDSQFRVSRSGTGNTEMFLTSSGNLSVFGDLSIGGTCTGCDAVFSKGYDLESIDEHADFMWANSYLPAVGPTADGQTRISVFEKTTGMLNELEKAHVYIQQLHDRLQQQESTIEKLQERLGALEVAAKAESR
jgi:hypothetical protein